MESVADWAAQVRRVAEVAYPEIARVKVFAAEPPFDPGSPIAYRVFYFQQVYGAETGHGSPLAERTVSCSHLSLALN